MVYRRFGSVYSRLLLSKQDELGRMEATLLAWDQTDLAEGNGKYLKSRSLDVGRAQIPEVWEGLSRVKLLENMEKVALEYGMYCSLRARLFRPRVQVCQTSLRFRRSTVLELRYRESVIVGGERMMGGSHTEIAVAPSHTVSRPS